MRHFQQAVQRQRAMASVSRQWHLLLAQGQVATPPLYSSPQVPCLQRRRCRSLWGMLSFQYGKESHGWETPRLVLLLAQGQVARPPSYPSPPVPCVQRRRCRSLREMHCLQHGNECTGWEKPRQRLLGTHPPPPHCASPAIVVVLAMIATLRLPLRIFMKRASTQLMSRTIKNLGLSRA